MLPLFSALIGLAGVTIAVLAWRVNVYAKHDLEAVSRIREWALEVGDDLQRVQALGVRAVCTAETPPFSYSIRSYAQHELIGDLEFVAHRERMKGC
ncbi:hypothetical protein [Pseudarthrobacter albicanus]|uniref:hypothetical protein n=1 Tax=Pseudarthrobacter albicanus TaxID=2823873 RepID=UPI001BA9AFF1|nr:hypothetical protein [Pseudarthrobacter albicanus]